MNNKLQQAVSVLTQITIDTTDAESLTKAISSNKDEVIQALQFIGDADFEGYIDATHVTLFKVCPQELEEHVTGCASTWLGLISQAWTEHDTDVSKAVSNFLEEDETSSDEVNHLNKCLGLEVSTPVQPIWSF